MAYILIINTTNNNIPTFYPCTPLAVTNIEHYNIDLEGKHVVFVGTGMVNLPLSLMLLNKSQYHTL